MHSSQEVKVSDSEGLSYNLVCDDAQMETGVAAVPAAWSPLERADTLVGAVTVAYMPRVKKVTNILSVGRWGNANNLKKAEELAMQGCEEVAKVIKAAF